MAGRIRLGVNIDHVATIRNARGADYPDPTRAAEIALDAGADGITAHLREDRRHISDRDIENLAAMLRDRARPLNLEMAVTSEMQEIALRHRPPAVCLVPERREELTTEGGLDAAGGQQLLAPIVRELVQAGIRVSLFIEADTRQLDAAVALGAPVVEWHTGAYCDTAGAARAAHLARIAAAAAHAERVGLECHAGHGLNFDTVAAIAAIPNIVELNIGHFLVGEAIFIGFNAAIRRMRSAMDAALSGVEEPRTGSVRR